MLFHLCKYIHQLSYHYQESIYGPYINNYAFQADNLYMFFYKYVNVTLIAVNHFMDYI